MQKMKLSRLRSLLGLCSGRAMTLFLEFVSVSLILFSFRKTFQRSSFAKLSTNTQMKLGNSLDYFTNPSSALCSHLLRLLVLKFADGSIPTYHSQNISIPPRTLSLPLLNNLASISTDPGRNLQEVKLFPPPTVSFLKREEEVGINGGPGL